MFSGSGNAHSSGYVLTVDCSKTAITLQHRSKKEGHPGGGTKGSHNSHFSKVK